MSFPFGLTRSQGTVVLAVLVAAACATPTEDLPTDGFAIPESGGTGGDLTAAGGMAAVGGDVMSVGGTGGTGGTMMGGKGGSGGGAGTGGTAAGKGGSSYGGMGGTGGGTGGTSAGKGSAGTATAFGGSAGVVETAGKGGSAGTGAAGRAAGGSGGKGAGGGAGTGSGGKGAGGTGAGGKATGGSAGTTGQMCVTSLMPNQTSGDLGSGAVCFDISGNMAGWQVSNLGTRTLTCNGTTAAPPAVPPAVNGHRIFQFGAGSPTYTGWSYW